MKLTARATALLALAALSVFVTPAHAQQWATTFYEASAPGHQMTVADIPWDKYTHVNHFAVSTLGDGGIHKYYLTQENIDAFIRSKPAGKKALISLIDYYEDFSLFPKSASPQNIDKFVTSIVDFVVSNGYDGVDLDWEKNVDVVQYGELIRKLRNTPGMQGKLIAMDVNPVHAPAVAANQDLIDQVNVMCYDFDWDLQFAWHNGALRSNESANALACDWKMKALIDAGVKRSKLGLGMPYYARRWPGATKPFDPSSFDWRNTIYYRDLIADATRWKPANQFYDSTYGGDYLSVPDLLPKEFISYTGTRFIKEALAWLKAEGFGGVMTYNVEYEFVKTASGDARFPLSASLYEQITPAKPDAVTTAVQAGSVNLTWRATFAATTFNVYRSRTAGGPYTKLGNVSTAAYADSTAAAGADYVYVVAGVNGAGEEGPLSNEASASMPAAPAPVAPPPLPPPPPPPVVEQITTRLEQNAGNVSYSGTWYTSISNKYSGGTAVRSLSRGARATFTFSGTGAQWIGTRDAFGGVARVYLDDVLIAFADAYSPSAQANVALYTVTNLPNRTHTLAIEVAGDKAQSSRGRWVSIDSFTYLNTTAGNSATSPSLSLDNSSSASFNEPAPGALRLGYARLSRGSAGYGIINRFENGVAAGKASIPASSLLDYGRVYVELDQNTSTGFAIANPNAQPISIEFFFTDEKGVDSPHATFTVPADGQVAKFLDEAPFAHAKPFHGTMTFVASEPVAVTAIRGWWNERSEFLFSTMSVADLSMTREEAAVIPHVAFGQGWTTNVALINSTDAPAQGTVTLSTGAAFPYSIAERGSQQIALAGSSDNVTTASVNVVPQPGSMTPYAVAVFAYKSNGVTVTQTSVPASSPGSTFELEARREASLRTGIALLNTSNQNITVSFDLQSRWHASRVIPANGRISLYVDEIAGFEDLPASFRGTLRVSSPAPSLVVLGLHTEFNARGELLVTTAPAFDERLANRNSEFIVPHFAGGSGYRTDFTVQAEAGATAPIELFDQTGKPLPLSSN